MGVLPHLGVLHVLRGPVDHETRFVRAKPCETDLSLLPSSSSLSSPKLSRIHVLRNLRLLKLQQRYTPPIPPSLVGRTCCVALTQPFRLLFLSQVAGVGEGAAAGTTLEVMVGEEEDMGVEGGMGEEGGTRAAVSSAFHWGCARTEGAD